MLRRSTFKRFACCQLDFIQNTNSCFSPAAATNDNVIVRPDTIFECRATTVKFGLGALNEIGRDVRGLYNSKRVAVISDATVSQLDSFHEMMKHIKLAQVDVALYNECRVEPTDESFVRCGKWLAESGADSVVVVGGGSCIDTAKAANLLAAHKDENPDFDLMRYLNAPIGQGKAPTKKLLPLVAVPSTTGTGSEMTPIAICDVVKLKLKTGMSFPQLVPSLAVCDPSLAYSLPKPVIAASGFDILCHAAESLTARPFYKRLQTFPKDPTKRVVRPASNGSNPYADFGCIEALRLLGLNYREAYNAPSDKPNYDAINQMTFASMTAGAAFGNSGVQICHANSYPLAGKVKPSGYKSPCCYPQYDDHPVLPHGFSVALTAPATFRMIGKMNDPEMNRRLLQAAQNLCPFKDPRTDFPDPRGEGEACGDALAVALIDIMKMLNMPNGISAAGFSEADIPELAKGALLQKRLLNNAPFDVELEHAMKIFEGSMKYW